MCEYCGETLYRLGNTVASLWSGQVGTSELTCPESTAVNREDQSLYQADVQ